MKKKVIALSGMAARSLLLIWALVPSGSAQTIDPPSEACGKYQLIYRAIVSRQNGREAVVDGSAAREIMNALLTCGEGRLSAANRSAFADEVKSLATVADGSSEPEIGILKLELIEALQSGIVDEERDIAHVIANRLKFGAIESIAVRHSFIETLKRRGWRAAAEKGAGNAAYIAACKVNVHRRRRARRAARSRSIRWTNRT